MINYLQQEQEKALEGIRKIDGPVRFRTDIKDTFMEKVKAMKALRA